MAKKISQMTWAEVQQEMSIAGDPEKITAVGKAILETLGKELDLKNRATLTNIEFMLQRVQAEVRVWQRLYDKKH